MSVPIATSPGRSRVVSLAALAAIPLILLLLGQLLSSQFDQSRQLRAEVDDSYAARLAVQRLLSVHQDMETGQRGYVLTGEAAFLEPFLAARGTAQYAMLDVERHLGSGMAVDAEIQELKRLTAEKIRFSDDVIALQRSGRGTSASARIAAGTGKAIMDRIRALIGKIDGAERARLRDSTAQADAARLAAQRYTFLLLTLLAVLLFGASWANQRSMEAKRRALGRAEDLTLRQQTIFDSAKDGIVMLDAHGRIESVNEAAERMFGYGPDELIGANVAQLFEAPPKAEEIAEFLRKLQRRRAGDVGRLQEFPSRRRDGSVFPADVAMSPVPLQEGPHYVAIVRDITERKQVDQMKSEFVATVSHELRTPLTSIAGSLGLLAGGAAGALPERADRLIRIAHSNSERLVRLINDILDIEKIESGQMSFDVRPLPLRPLLEQAVQANRAFAEALGVELVLRPGGEGAIVMADQDRLMQVLTNLLSNAAKFSPRDQIVEISATPRERQVRISVADRGPGISDAFKPRIFGKFAQADSSDTRQKGGTGLGLSIAKEIVLKLGGAISFESNAGHGTIFHVDLPALDGGAPVPPRADLPRILHVDDDPDVLHVAADALRSVAIVHTAHSIEEAREALGRERFDLLILDVTLADGSGLPLVPELERRQGRRIPVILFTAQDGGPALASHADAVLTKSRDSLDALAATVGRLLAAEGKA
jgi:PAS domain S-box-containing protein